MEEVHYDPSAAAPRSAKEQARWSEVVRAYNKTVASLMEITRENAAIEHDRDLWKARAEGAAVPFNIGGMSIELTPAEVGAIRKAMARLHHPDAGGDAEADEGMECRARPARRLSRRAAPLLLRSGRCTSSFLT
ncbi:MAG: hypothetical protein U0Z44_09775 [Kouleothrix sp.]